MSIDPPRGPRRAGHGRQDAVVRKDADGVQSIGPTWESVTERIIREAQERGEFDHLPGHGRPLVVDQNPYAGDMALAFHLLRNARIAPPWIEADKEVRRLRDTIEGSLARAHRAPLPMRASMRRDLERIVADHDAAVLRLNAEAPSPRQHRRPMGRDAALAALERAFRGEAPEPPHPSGRSDASDPSDAGRP
jgi:hypothetical protein